MTQLPPVRFNVFDMEGGNAVELIDSLNRNENDLDLTHIFMGQYYQERVKFAYPSQSEEAGTYIYGTPIKPKPGSQLLEVFDLASMLCIIGTSLVLALALALFQRWYHGERVSNLFSNMFGVYQIMMRQDLPPKYVSRRSQIMFLATLTCLFSSFVTWMYSAVVIAVLSAPGN